MAVLPSSDKTVFNLIKSYFNIYSAKEENYTKSKRLRVRRRKNTVNRVLVGKPGMKHTNDKVIIVAHTYNARKNHYVKALKESVSMDNFAERLPKQMVDFMYNLKQKSTTITSLVAKHSSPHLESPVLNKHNSMLKRFGKVYLKAYVKKYLGVEISSIKRKQFMLLEKFKYNKHYMLPLINLIERIYNKQVIFNVIDLKYFYNSASIFSEALIAKLKNRKNSPTRVLKNSLDLFELPPIDRVAVYNETYNKVKLMQNIQVKNLVEPTLSSMDNQGYDYKYDPLDKSLISLGPNTAFSIPPKTPPSLNDVVGLVKRKFTSGIRIELAGRLTRRNTAARSMFKLKQKGSIRNTDSSYKRLSAVLLRGYAKSNLQYSQVKSKVRIGSYGLKS